MDPTTPPGGGPTAPHAPAPAPRPSGGDGFFGSVRRTGLLRTQDRWIGGVCGGIARRLGIDPLLVRGVVAVTVLLGGAGLVLYGIAWALLPEEVDGRIHLEETVQGRFDAAVLGAIALVVVGLNRGDGWVGSWDAHGLGWVDALLWTAALAAVIALVVAAVSQRSAARTARGARDGGWSAESTWAASGTRGARTGTVPHPGYGTVPLTAPAAGTPASTAPAAGPPSGTVPPPPPPTWAGPPVPPAAGTGPGASGEPGGGGDPRGLGGAGQGGGDGAPPGDVSDPAGMGGLGGPAGPGGPLGPTPYRPPHPTAPPRPAKARVQGPGVGAVGTVVGLTLLALALLLLLQRSGSLVGLPVGPTALGIGVLLAGLAIMVAGLRGRSGGALGLLAVVGIVAAVPVVLAPSAADRFGLVRGPEGLRVASGETWAPQTTAEARDGIDVGFGDLRVDLTEVPLTGGVVEVPVRMSAGQLLVVVPEDAAVTAEVALTAGEFRWDVDGVDDVDGPAGFSGFTGGRPQVYASDEVADGDVQLAVRITGGAGDVRVVEEDR